MLKKCLKYDLAAVFRVAWILIVVAFAATVGTGACLRLCMEFSQYMGAENPMYIMLNLFGTFGSYLGAMGGYVVVIAATVVASILVYWRVYSNFFTDEGYLTFTLPVKRSTLYLSKVLTCTVVELSLLAALLAGALIVFPFVMPTEGFALVNVEMFKELFLSYREIYGTLGLWPIVWLLLSPLYLVATQIANSGLTFLCITLGASIFKKGKLLAAIGIYWLVNQLVSVGIWFGSFPLAFGMAALGWVLVTSPMLSGFLITLAMVIFTALTVIGALLLHFINLTLLERKLNLA